jgi:hypothetical protein
LPWSIWSRFKAASAVINRRHQQYFELQKEAEQNNLDQKTVICEIIEGMEYDTFKTFADWEDKTKEILALQAKWKTIGPTPQKMNTSNYKKTVISLSGLQLRDGLCLDKNMQFRVKMHSSVEPKQSPRLLLGTHRRMVAIGKTNSSS